MNKRLYIGLIILTCLVWGGQKADAKKVNGYIVTNENDTIKGLVNLYRFSLSSGSVFLGDFNSEMVFVEVSFKGPDHKKFVIYDPIDIKGYGFLYKGEQYAFETHIVKSNTFVYKDSKKIHFLQKIKTTKGRYVYKHQIYRLDPGTRELIPYYVFYVIDKNGELIKIKY